MSKFFSPRIKPSPKSRKWKTLASSYAMDTPWLRVKKERVLLPTGKIIDDFYSIEGAELVSVLAVNKKRRVMLVRQYRQAVNQATWDLPGGSVELGETPYSAAQRELVEETGFAANQLRKIVTYFPDSGKKGDIKHLFFANDLNKASGSNMNPDEAELIDIKWFSLKRILDGISRGAFNEATLQLAVLHYVRFMENEM